jgi:hypothetical protein
MMGGGVNLPWNLTLSALIGLSLLFTPITLNAGVGMANAHHLIGSLVLTIVSIAAAEVARPVRFLNILTGTVLAISPLMYETDFVGAAVSVLAGAALVSLSFRRGTIRERYGNWSRLLV